ncbi:MAG TPA: hypothetical protein VLJ15_03830 [Gammaproteobacteria bacterium]|nr:hypothetical protein [Gammaproteobacteria bacterium]
MPKKKKARHPKMKKPTAKLQKQKGVLLLAEKVEKEFRQLPARLARLYRQELMAQKQQESKWKADINKAKALQKNAEKKQAALRAKTTPSAKKQWLAAQKANHQAEKTIKTLTLQLKQLVQKNEALRAKQNKFAWLGKELQKLEKQFSSKRASAKPLKKPAAKRVKSNLRKQAEQSMMANQGAASDAVMDSPETETAEM